ncbi:phospholipase D-like domain-containing protein [Flavobacterium hauense]
MKFIPPLEIASQIMTLIQEADKKLIIVSPYVNINDWDKMKRCLSKAVANDIEITFIARKNAKQDFSELKAIGITPILVDDLHAKVYISESHAIVSSLNMVHYSDIKSIDVAYKTDQEAERKELVDFVNKYVLAGKTKVEKQSITKTVTFQRISRQNYDDKKQFNDYQVEKIFQSFVDNFRNSFFKRTSSYVFCDNLLPFADVMIDSRYVIKIRKSRTDCEQILNKLEDISYDGYNEYKIELLITHPSFYYIEIIPQKGIELQKLIEDYLSFTDKILRSDVYKVMKKQYNNSSW